MESGLVHWSWVRATRRGILIRSKLLCETTMGGMRNQVLARICTSAIYGSTQNLIRNKSVYDCYRQSLIFGKIKKSTNKHCRRLRIFAKRPILYWPYLQKYQRYGKMPHIKFIEQKKIFCELQYEKLKKIWSLASNMSLCTLWCPELWIRVYRKSIAGKRRLVGEARKRKKGRKPGCFFSSVRRQFFPPDETINRFQSTPTTTTARLSINQSIKDDERLTQSSSYWQRSIERQQWETG